MLDIEDIIQQRKLTESKNIIKARYLVLVIVFILTIGSSLNMFYFQGASILDQGQFVGMFWKSSFWVQNPQISLGTVSHYVYADHFVPFHFFWSFLSSFIPLTPAINFITFHAVGLTLFIFSLQKVVEKSLPSHDLKLYIAPLFAILFFFSGFTLAYNNYPHSEIFAVAFGFLFLVNLGEKKYFNALFFFLCSLSVREDIGFHLSGILICISLLRFFKSRETNKYELLFALLGIVYSIGALIFQKLLFGEVRMTKAYLGDPFLYHLSLDVIKDRFLIIYETKQFFWVPIITLVVVSIFTRMPQICLGVVAFIPWFIFNLISTNFIAATFQIYFAIFFVFSIFWPILSLLFFKSSIYVFKKISYTNFLIIVQGIVILQSIILNPFLINNFVHKVSPQDITQLEILSQSLPHLQSPSIKFGIDDGIASLNPTEFTNDNLSINANEPLNTVLFFGHGYRFIHSLYSILAFGLNDIYRYGNTNVYVATNCNEINKVIPWLIKQNFTYEYNWKEFLSGFSFQMMENINFKSMSSNQLFSPNISNSYYCGPGLPLPDGNYILTINVDFENTVENIPSEVEMSLVCSNERAVLKTENLSVEKSDSFEFKFNIPWSKVRSKFEFNIRAIKGNNFRIKGFILKYLSEK